MIDGQTEEAKHTRTRIATQAKYRILRFLLDSKHFLSYTHRESPLFQPPPPVDELPVGPEHTVRQHILRTANIEEASYDGNIKVLEQWLKELEMDSIDALKHLSTNLIIPIVGDQLTHERLMGLIKFRSKNINGLERFDWMTPSLGWWHLLAHFAMSLLKQYEGTSGGFGLKRAFKRLNRKGLQSANVHIKGPYYHHLDEALWHIGEATVLACWLEVSGHTSLRDLLSKSPEELLELADKIYNTCASRAAVEKCRILSEDAQDEVRAQSVMFLSDILVYFDLRTAIKCGDVGRMEDLMPSLLYRFAGGGNPKYTILLLDLYQNLKCEWPPELA
jgi:hypothetical protein